MAGQSIRPTGLTGSAIGTGKRAFSHRPVPGRPPTAHVTMVPQAPSPRPKIMSPVAAATINFLTVPNGRLAGTTDHMALAATEVALYTSPVSEKATPSRGGDAKPWSPRGACLATERRGETGCLFRQFPGPQRTRTWCSSRPRHPYRTHRVRMRVPAAERTGGVLTGTGLALALQVIGDATECAPRLALPEAPYAISLLDLTGAARSAT